jgi:Zn-dependent protease with chaperone function
MNNQYLGTLYFTNSSDSFLVEIYIDVQNLKAKIKNNGEIISLPLSGIIYEIAGDEKDYLLIKGKDVFIYCKDKNIIDDLIKASNEYQKEKLNQIKVKLNISKKNRMLLPIYFLSSLVGIIFIIYIILILSVEIFIKLIPLSWEEAIGNTAYTLMAASKEIKDNEIKSSIEKIGYTLDKNSSNKRYKLKFHIVKDDSINAYALPSGDVVIFTGLIKKSDSPEEIAGVLAHELNHIYQRHSTKRIIKRFGLSILLALILGDLGSTLDSIGGNLASLKFDRDEEREADKKGLELLVKSKINPNGMISFFKKIHEIDKSLPKVFSFISTHPNTEERIAYIQEITKNNYSNINFDYKFDFNWNNIKEKVKEASLK